MAERRSFPMLPATHWWGLRKKFKQSIPGAVTANYLASLFNMQERSARNNILPYLRDFGIIDEEGKTLDRARQWRDDAQYKQVCDEIRKEVYPPELLEAVPNPSEERGAAERWFANHTGAGEAAVRKMVASYTLLSEGDASKEPDSRRDDAVDSKRKRTAAADKRPAKSERIVSRKDLETPQANSDNRKRPDLNINLQIHISSDATPDQIEQIFASMGKHIYKS
jgi:hypothetical protein